jgi:hypothetical protein
LFKPLSAIVPHRPDIESIIARAYWSLNSRVSDLLSFAVTMLLAGRPISMLNADVVGG